MKRLRTLKSFQIFQTEKNLKPIVIDALVYSMPIQWFHSHKDPIWPDGIFEWSSAQDMILILLSQNKVRMKNPPCRNPDHS
jgi:hypothetical protein